MSFTSLATNKQVLLALGMIVFVGAVLAAGTGAFFSSQATNTGNVFMSGTLTLLMAHNENGNYESTKSAAWNFSDMAPGGDAAEDSIWLKNDGSIDGMTMGLALANSSATEPGMGEKLRITKMTLGGVSLLEGGAGATIGKYDKPTNCDVTVVPGNLATTVNAATPNQTICVDAGSYNPGDLTIAAEGVTIVGLKNPDSSNAASVTGSFNITANNVTIRGLKIMNPSGSYGILVSGVDGAQIKDNVLSDIGTGLTNGSAQAIYLDGDASVAGLTISGNQISNVGNTSLGYISGNSSAKGIYIGDTVGGGTITNVAVENNVITDVNASTAPWAPASNGGAGAYGILVNYAGTTDIDVTNNSISDLEGLWAHAVGLEGDTPNATVTFNDISDLTDHKSPSDAVGVMLEDNAYTSSIVINHNNLADGVSYGIVNAGGAAVNGQSNWWGDDDGSDQVGGSVNTFGELSGAVTGLINGNDWNGNGYADLQDLYNEPLVGANVGLDAGQKKLFKMAIQLDASTGNEYQGDSYTTDFVFTLNQQ
jgi:hypothetical protein